MRSASDRDVPGSPLKDVRPLKLHAMDRVERASYVTGWNECLKECQKLEGALWQCYDHKSSIIRRMERALKKAGMDEEEIGNLGENAEYDSTDGSECSESELSVPAAQMFEVLMTVKTRKCARRTLLRVTSVTAFL